ncbi:hypothetical protein [Kamptonema sp. UHCC 0994]|nr:hypothetical protein [Kamptonema sp. UHCC 0994]MDF0552962.1 hypothetical protein [Kamptonema sp. UHCC 0994]
MVSPIKNLIAAWRSQLCSNSIYHNLQLFAAAESRLILTSQIN